MFGSTDSMGLPLKLSISSLSLPGCTQLVMS